MSIFSLSRLNLPRTVSTGTPVATGLVGLLKTTEKTPMVKEQMAKLAAAEQGQKGHLVIAITDGKRVDTQWFDDDFMKSWRNAQLFLTSAGFRVGVLQWNEGQGLEGVATSSVKYLRPTKENTAFLAKEDVVRLIALAEGKAPEQVQASFQSRVGAAMAKAARATGKVLPAALVPGYVVAHAASDKLDLGNVGKQRMINGYSVGLIAGTAGGVLATTLAAPLVPVAIAGWTVVQSMLGIVALEE